MRRILTPTMFFIFGFCTILLKILNMIMSAPVFLRMISVENHCVKSMGMRMRTEGIRRQMNEVWLLRYPTICGSTIPSRMAGMVKRILNNTISEKNESRGKKNPWRYSVWVSMVPSMIPMPRNASTSGL